MPELHDCRRLRRRHISEKRAEIIDEHEIGAVHEFHVVNPLIRLRIRRFEAVSVTLDDIELLIEPPLLDSVDDGSHIRGGSGSVLLEEQYALSAISGLRHRSRTFR